MKDKINVAELLKDCPQGMELDCTMFEDVYFERVDKNVEYPIAIRVGKTQIKYLTEEGCYHAYSNAKCVIFPKGKTTWEGFQIPFKDGDIVSTTYGTWIGIVKKSVNSAYETYITINGESLIYDNPIFCFEKFATEEERQKLFQAIKDNGYKWNAETKTLEKADELQPYNKETMDKVNKAVFDANAQCCDIMNPLIKGKTMESKPNLLQQLKEYFDNTPRDVLEKEWHEYDKYNEIGPIVDEYLKYVKKYRQSNQYPKTYKECCNVLGLNTMDNDAQGYEAKLIIRFQELLIARNAYWKIAGEQMGLGKPWNQDYNDRCFVIANNSGNIHTYEYHGSDNVILAFPTEEIRDTFYKNFKDLIEGCKELL